MSQQAIFDKKNVLIIGGAGFIGSYLCDELIKTSKVICLDNFSSGDEKNIDHLLSESDFEFIKHDLSEPIDLEKLPELQKFKIEFQGIQEIYNLACPTSPKYFLNNKVANILANSYLVKNSLDLAIKYQAKFLHFSSSVIYGPRGDDNKKMSEIDHGSVDILSSRSSYDEGKRFAETIVSNFQTEYNIDAKIIRLFRIYGPRMKHNEGHMIPDFIFNALQNKDLEIFGDENFSSSFCYVSDVIDAAIKIMDSGQAGSAYNIGSDINLKIIEIANKIKAATESISEIKYTDKLLFMSELCLPDISRARNELGWMPIVTLNKGLEKTIAYVKANKDLKK
jgi:UDP-glucuronate decarboxylase